MTLPIPEKALMQHIAVVGSTGAGKSFLIRYIVEQMLKMGRQCAIFDPTGVWWGIRSSLDGRESGYPVVIFGAEHMAAHKPQPDIVIDDKMGEIVADFVVDGTASCIVDFSGFSDAAICRFMTAYLQRVFIRNSIPVYHVFDEADTYAPQRPQPGETRMLGLMAKFLKQGRTKGLRNILITQRPAVLSKTVLSQVKTMVCLALSLPHDVKPIQDWFRQNTTTENYKRVMDEMGLLPVGTGYVCSPVGQPGGYFARTEFPMISTFDSMKTPEDDDDIESLRPQSWNDVDLTAISSAIKLQRKSEEKPVKDNKAANSKNNAKVLKAEYDRGVQDGRKDIQRHNQAQIDEARTLGRREGWNEAFEAIEGVKEKWKPELLKRANHLVTVVEIGKSTPDISPPPKAKTKKPPLPADWKNPLVDAARDIWPAKLTWSQLCATVGRKASGGHFNKSRKHAIEHGFVGEEDGLVILRDPPDTTGKLPADLLSARLIKPANLMFDQIRRYPGFDWGYCAEAIGIAATGGYFNKGRSILRNNAITVEDSEDGGLSINPALLRPYG